MTRGPNQKAKPSHVPAPSHRMHPELRTQSAKVRHPATTTKPRPAHTHPSSGPPTQYSPTHPRRLCLLLCLRAGGSCAHRPQLRPAASSTKLNHTLQPHPPTTPSSHTHRTQHHSHNCKTQVCLTQHTSLIHIPLTPIQLQQPGLLLYLRAGGGGAHCPPLRAAAARGGVVPRARRPADDCAKSIRLGH